MEDYNKYFYRIFFFILSFTLLVFFKLQEFQVIFNHNKILNSVICGIFFIGLFFSVYNLVIIFKEKKWIDNFFSKKISSYPYKPKIFKELFSDNSYSYNESLFEKNFALTKYIETASSRFDNDRDVNKYVATALILLGLLGTFWGLLITVSSVGSIINSMGVDDQDILSNFLTLKDSLKNPLSGMGTAFSTSLFGLTGSLSIGFLDLQVSRAQDQLLIDTENKLIIEANKNKKTYQQSSAGINYIEALLQQNAESLSNLQNSLEKNENSRKDLESLLVTVTSAITKINDEINIRVSQSYKNEIASIEHLRNIDNTLKLLKEDIKKSNTENTEELLKEIKVLSKTISFNKKM